MRYLASSSSPSAVSVEILGEFEVENYFEDGAKLLEAGYRIARYSNTGLDILVRSRENRRYLKAWGYVTDFDTYRIDTIANEDGVIWGKIGSKGRKIFGKVV
tara:strand:- start:609 stop:914 length:306 start_codon:yes stop_codon:yes gene_type:complete